MVVIVVVVLMVRKRGTRITYVSLFAARPAVR